MQETEEPVVTLDELTHGVGRGAETGVAGDLLDEGLGQVDRDPGLDVGVRARPRHLTTGDEEEEAQVRVVLPRQTGEHVLEPVARLVDHRDGHHGRSEGGGLVHDAARLAVRHSGRPSPRRVSQGRAAA